MSWGSDLLETRESKHLAEWAPRPPIEQLQLEIRQVGEKMLDWGTCPREAGSQGTGWAAKENGIETRLWPIEWGSICCSSVWSPTPSHTQPFQIKWEVYFSRELCRSYLLCRRYDSACICIRVYNTWAPPPAMGLNSTCTVLFCGDVRGVMVIVVGNGHGDTSSNPGRNWLHFT